MIYGIFIFLRRYVVLRSRWMVKYLSAIFRAGRFGILLLKVFKISCKIKLQGQKQ